MAVHGMFYPCFCLTFGFQLHAGIRDILAGDPAAPAPDDAEANDGDDVGADVLEGLPPLAIVLHDPNAAHAAGAAHVDEFEARRREAQTIKLAAYKFLGHPESLRQVILMRLPMDPHLLLMKRFLKISAQSRETQQLKQLAATGSRVYRLSRALGSEYELGHLEENRRLFATDYSSIPSQTLASHCQLFSSLARSGATNYQLMIRRHVQYHYRVFWILAADRDHPASPFWTIWECLCSFDCRLACSLEALSSTTVSSHCLLSQASSRPAPMEYH